MGTSVYRGFGEDKRITLLRHSKIFSSSILVPEVGLEPTSLAAHDFESCMFANFITLAYFYLSSKSSFSIIILGDELVESLNISYATKPTTRPDFSY